MSEKPRIGINKDTEADKLGNYTLANGRFDDDADTHEDPRLRSGSSRSADTRGKSHVNRRGGRSYSEPSDSELDRNWNDKDNLPQTDAERASTRAGLALAREALAKSRQTETAAEKADRHAQESAALRKNASDSWSKYKK